MFKLFRKNKDNVLPFARTSTRKSRPPSRNQLREEYAASQKVGHKDSKAFVSKLFASFRLAFVQSLGSIALSVLGLILGLVQLAGCLALCGAIIGAIMPAFVFFAHWKGISLNWQAYVLNESVLILCFLLSTWVQIVLNACEDRLTGLSPVRDRLGSPFSPVLSLVRFVALMVLCCQRHIIYRL